MPDGLNKVMLIGNLGADPEMRYMASGTAMTGFRLAVSRSFIDGDKGRKEETEWVSVVTWAKLAELLGQHLHKGRKVYVEGRLQSRSWDKPDGTKGYKTEVIASNVLFLDKRDAGDFPEIGGEVAPDDLPFE